MEYYQKAKLLLLSGVIDHYEAIITYDRIMSKFKSGRRENVERDLEFVELRKYLYDLHRAKWIRDSALRCLGLKDEREDEYRIVYDFIQSAMYKKEPRKPAGERAKGPRKEMRRAKAKLNSSYGRGKSR